MSEETKPWEKDETRKAADMVAEWRKIGFQGQDDAIAEDIIKVYAEAIEND